jgi:hypothetical protein
VSAIDAAAFRRHARAAADHAREDDAPDPLTWRTLADVDGSPPGELLLGMLERDGANLLYAKGGTGKGATCAWYIRELHAKSIRPLVYDAERHPREWRRRTEGLGVPPEFVVYRDPTELPSYLLGKPIEYIVPHLGEVARDAGCGILFVDSVLAAANVSEDALRSDAGAPYRYVAALGELGIPSVSLGHTAKMAPGGDPYGSVSWTNAMRLTWHGIHAEGEGHRVRWTPRKRNERGHIPAVLLSFSYDPEDRLCAVRREDDETTTRAWVTDALMGGPRTVDDLAEELADLDDGPHAEAVLRAKELVRKTLGRMRHSHLVHKTGGRGAPWALGAPPRVSRNGRRDTDE